MCFLSHAHKTDSWYLGDKISDELPCFICISLQATYCLTCKFSHVWFKVQFSQIYVCGNFVIIQTFLSLECRPVVVDAAVIQLKSSIVNQMGTKGLSVNSI